MTTLIKNADVRTIALGINVSRAAAQCPTVALSPQSIFTVSGGRIVLVSLTGHVTTVMSGTVTTLAVGLTPTEGAATNVSTALASATAVTSLEVGSNVGLGLTAGAALVVGANASVPLVLAARQIINTGVITLTGSATNTGFLKWDLTYIPLDTAAQVVSN